MAALMDVPMMCTTTPGRCSSEPVSSTCPTMLASLSVAAVVRGDASMAAMMRIDESSGMRMRCMECVVRMM